LVTRDRHRPQQRELLLESGRTHRNDTWRISIECRPATLVF